jgi:hypothetical protein
MSLIGSVLLRATAPGAVKRFDVSAAPPSGHSISCCARSCGPTPTVPTAAATASGDQHVAPVPGTGADRHLRGPRAVHQGGHARRAQPAHQAFARAVHDHQRDHGRPQVHLDDPRESPQQGAPHLAAAGRSVPGSPGDRGRQGPQRGEPRGRVVRPPAASPAGPSPATPTAPRPSPSGRCTPRPMGCSPSRTTRPGTTRCCAWPPARTSVALPRSARARSCCWPSGSPVTLRRSSATSGTARCRLP